MSKCGIIWARFVLYVKLALHFTFNVMIELELYRFQIGKHACARNGRSKRSSKVKSLPTGNGIVFDDDYSVVIRSVLYFLYTLLIVYILAITMSMSIHFISPQSSFKVHIHPHVCAYISYVKTIYSIRVTKVIVRKMVFNIGNFSNFRCFITKNIRFVMTFLSWITVVNLVLVIIVNPSLLNPGPIAPLSVLYHNVQGLIPIKDVAISNPKLNVTKLLELKYLTNSSKYDVIMLNET